MRLARVTLIWAALVAAVCVPIAAAAASPLLEWRNALYIVVGFAGIMSALRPVAKGSEGHQSQREIVPHRPVRREGTRRRPSRQYRYGDRRIVPEVGTDGFETEGQNNHRQHLRA